MEFHEPKPATTSAVPGPMPEPALPSPVNNLGAIAVEDRFPTGYGTFVRYKLVKRDESLDDNVPVGVREYVETSSALVIGDWLAIVKANICLQQEHGVIDLASSNLRDALFHSLKTMAIGKVMSRELGYADVIIYDQEHSGVCKLAVVMKMLYSTTRYTLEMDLCKR